MAPQPLSRVRSKGTIHASSDVYRKYPALARWVSQIIGDGASMDYLLGSLLTSFLKASPKPGMAMYIALTGAESRRSALAAAARAVLTPDDLMLFEALMLAIAPARRIRNNIAHHQHGWMQSLPDHLLLMDPEAMLEVEVARHIHDKKPRKEIAKTPRPTLDRSLVQVYKLKDLEEAAKVCRRALSNLALVEVFFHVSTGVSLNADTRRTLLAEPEIAQGLLTLQGRKPPKSQRPVIRKTPPP